MKDRTETDPDMAAFFEFEYCSECGGDARHHAKVPGPFGLPFYACRHEPDEDGVPHPTVQADRAADGCPVEVQTDAR